MAKLSSDEYGYTAEHNSSGVTVNLVQASSGKNKIFFIAGIDNTESILLHMDSLTDDLCGQWFASRDHKKNKNKKEKGNE